MLLVDVFIYSTAMLGAICWLHLCRRVRPSVPTELLLKMPLETASDMEALCAKMVFIRDVCDGDTRKADALVAEKMAQNPHFPADNAVDLVFLDALALMEEVKV